MKFILVITLFIIALLSFGCIEEDLEKDLLTITEKIMDLNDINDITIGNIIIGETIKQDDYKIVIEEDLKKTEEELNDDKQKIFENQETIIQPITFEDYLENAKEESFYQKTEVTINGNKDLLEAWNYYGPIRGNYQSFYTKTINYFGDKAGYTNTTVMKFNINKTTMDPKDLEILLVKSCTLGQCMDLTKLMTNINDILPKELSYSQENFEAVYLYHRLFDNIGKSPCFKIIQKDGFEEINCKHPTHNITIYSKYGDVETNTISLEIRPLSEDDFEI